MSLEGFVNKCLVPADAGHRPNLAAYGHCRDRPRPLGPHEMAHGPGGPVDTSVRELAGATTGRRTRQFGAQRGADVSTTRDDNGTGGERRVDALAKFRGRTDVCRSALGASQHDYDARRSEGRC